MPVPVLPGAWGKGLLVSSGSIAPTLPGTPCLIAVVLAPSSAKPPGIREEDKVLPESYAFDPVPVLVLS